MKKLQLKNKNSEPLKIFIYRDKENLLVMSLAYSIEDSIASLSGKNNVFNFIGTLDAAELVSRIEIAEPVPSPIQQVEIGKDSFLYGLMYVADKFVTEPKDQKSLKKIISKIPLKS